MKDFIKELCPEIADWQAELIAEHCQRKRKLVGLTIEDYAEVKPDSARDFILGARWAEAKLKEKNT
jgi:hypothetical protein